jgi:hypothetical protein
MPAQVTSTKSVKLFLISKIVFGGLSVLLWGACIIAYANPRSEYNTVEWLYVLAFFHSIVTIALGCWAFASLNDLRRQCAELASQPPPLPAK